ncbi:Hypothetical protein LUCI_3506 [Lucifera butyrica]|uniref:Uncharacterized protein n=1 Tax=Lucifera butyrica TaxID=1351585 RepID=A0A498RBG2_9FIRM|nr:hypothetical protein [Lucifera butyrica]VBB08237.1 Hypothetical protein LUCI_3506 [Lucifera butyrica]
MIRPKGHFSWEEPEIREWEDRYPYDDYENRCPPIAVLLIATAGVAVTCRPRYHYSCYPYSPCRPWYGWRPAYYGWECYPQYGTSM